MDVVEISAEDLEESIAWLKMFNEPHSRVLELWKQTAKPRLMSVFSDNKGTLELLIDQWPRLRDSKGYLLVSIFFKNIMLTMFCVYQNVSELAISKQPINQ